MEDLHICLIQSELHWESTNKNLEMFSRKIAEIKEKTDLIILPEMFNSGFSMNVAVVAENMGGETITWMSKMAEKTSSVICGSVVIESEGRVYNRFIWMRPDGSYAHYDKRHLFRMADEDKYYNAGEKNITVELKGWKIRPLICYDLRFPVWSRNKLKDNNYEFDTLIYVANWPSPRVNAWDILLKARAVENQVYCIGLNRVGKDDGGRMYTGHSAVIDPKGNYLLGPVEKIEGIYHATLNFEELRIFRGKFPQGLDADNFQIT